MKTTTFPPLRVDPKLRSAAESVLAKGESLSSFVEQSIRSSVQSRQMQAEFLERGLSSREEARVSGKYHSAASVVAEIGRRVRKAEATARNKRSR